MFKSSRERFLAFGVIIAILVSIGMYCYRTMGDQWTLMFQGTEERRAEIHGMLDIQEKSVEIKERYDKMMAELKVDGTNSEQAAAIRKHLVSILEQVGLNNQYDQISPREPRKEDDFKLISFNIQRIECTPQQLGQLLYQLEKDSKVIEVEKCRITNLVSEVGKPTSIRIGSQMQSGKLAGMLEVDLQISRLIEYGKGEKPVKRGRT